jgi:hypothetical protein
MNSVPQISLTGHVVVDLVGQLSFEGNIIPHTWYQHIRYTNKRGTYVDAIAILLLAEIVYWYRPSVVHDETTGRVIGWKKKFKGDKLKRSYAALCEKLGTTDKQIRDAMSLLKSLGLVDIDLRTELVGEVRIGNVMYVGLNAQRLHEISYTLSPNPVTPLSQKEDTSPRNEGEGMPNSDRGIPEIGSSSIYKEITPKNSSEISTYTAANDAAAALKKINSDPVREDCLEPKTLEEREQALLKGNDPHEESISSPHEESHFVYSDQEVILPSEKTTHEDKSCGAASFDNLEQSNNRTKKNKVGMTTDNDINLASVVFRNAGIKENPQIKKLTNTYSLEDICGAIAHLDAYENKKDEEVENPGGYLTDALKCGWVDEMAERGEIPQERKREWLVGHTARLLGLCSGFSVFDNMFVLQLPDKQIDVDLTAFTKCIDNNGWERVYGEYWKAIGMVTVR